MKLITLIIIITLVQASAKGYGQKITLNETNATLEKVLKAVEKQSGFVFFYDAEDVKQVVNVHVKNASLEDALAVCLKNVALTYKIAEKTIFLQRRKSEVNQRKNPLAITELIDVHGKVIDEKGVPLPGVTVTVKATGKTAITASNGEFNLTGVDENADILFSFIGYKTVSVKARRELSTIQLEASVSSLDNVQVIGYGTTTKRLTTGSIATIKAEDIEKQPVSNPILTLAGRMAGVQVTEGSGISGGNFRIIIQGQNTINAGLLPLYIIDGVPFGGQPIESTAGASTSAPPIVGGTGISPLNTLSPNDIESISILKDADATAIYGSRAANGVVLITTKKGRSGKTKLDVDVYSGISEINRMLPMLNAEQYLIIRNQAFKNDGITPTTSNAADLTQFNTGSNNNFQKIFFGNTGHFTNANATLSGGNELTQFLVSANVRHEGSILPGNSADDRAEVRYNLQHHTADNKFFFNTAVSFTKDNNNIVPLYINQIYALPPNLPLYNSSGKLAWYTGYNNPAAALKNVYSVKTNNLLANATVGYNILPGFSFKTDLGYNRIGVNSLNATLIAAQNPANAASATGEVTKISTTNELIVIEPQLNYARNFGKGKLEALLGGTYQNANNDQDLFLLGAFRNDALYNDLGSITPLINANGSVKTRYASVFSRLNFNWDNKYIISGSYRRDGSSRFSPGNRFGNFGSVGAAWIFSEEDFIKNNLSWLSFGKLRGSYGSIGNDQINDYGYAQLYQSGFTSYNGQTGLSPSSIVNDGNYSWEVTKKFNLAIDLGLLKDRISISGNFFRNRTSNLLVYSVPVASQAGFDGYTGNLPGTLVQNRGFEFELNTSNISSKRFTWKTSANLTIARNKLLAYPGLSTAYYSTGYFSQGYAIGQSLNLLSGYQYTGMVNGITKVADLNGDGFISPGLAINQKGDFDILGTKDPKFYGGLNNSISFDRFQLDFLFQFVKQKAYNIYSYLNTFGFPAPGGNYNLPEDILKYNISYSTLASSDAAQAYNNYFKLSSATVSDASFIRLKNVSLNYKFPQGIKEIGVKNLSIYLRGQNLWTKTKYVGFDPETQGTGIPPLKLYTLGLQASF
ncbi:SusC/RagA family TonB-linked outer membrane protein [Pedobacter sp. MR22-3]|uniref:SusC/RagA family TonB-linked outer membrane protein n=1 Tax=Pedobacter sp. MR22-3 TaxID=2994552 RepID=UPI0022461FAE|nr:SusC/RagA family TonB-linked outer membrane protein [Pedobacter sp. MR22-3]MCX2584439.1 SusC/RagA family TonB-linked outer membrane protein [Pedobacter sp. MR22-3]